MIFIYDGAPAHRNPQNPGPNTDPKKLPLHSPFLIIVKQAISCPKAAIIADISRPDVQVRMDDREEARNRGLMLGNFNTQFRTAVSPPRNALAGIDLRRLIYWAALMLKRLSAGKPQARNANSLLF